MLCNRFLGETLAE